MSPTITRAINHAVRRALHVLRAADVGDSNPSEACLLTGGSAAPTTLEERLIVEALAGPGRLRVDALVPLVAAVLYREELRHGGSAADLGLFGARVFVPDVLRALEAGNGRLWTISAVETSKS